MRPLKDILASIDAELTVIRDQAGAFERARRDNLAFDTSGIYLSMAAVNDAFEELGEVIPENTVIDPHQTNRELGSAVNVPTNRPIPIGGGEDSNTVKGVGAFDRGVVGQPAVSETGTNADDDETAEHERLEDADATNDDLGGADTTKP